MWGNDRMIVDKPYYNWIYVIPSDWYFPIAYKGKTLTREEYLEHWGKWIILGEREKLDEMAAKLDPYVEDRTIQSIKYDRSPQKIFGLEECALLAFCDDRERDEVWGILAGLGVTLKSWVYERETIEMWMPGGFLIEKWIEAHGLESGEAEKVRQETKERYEKWLSSLGKEGRRGAWSFEQMG